MSSNVLKFLFKRKTMKSFSLTYDQIFAISKCWLFNNIDVIEQDENYEIVTKFERPIFIEFINDLNNILENSHPLAITFEFDPWCYKYVNIIFNYKHHKSVNIDVTGFNHPDQLIAYNIILQRFKKFYKIESDIIPPYNEFKSFNVNFNNCKHKPVTAYKFGQARICNNKQPVYVEYDLDIIANKSVIDLAITKIHECNEQGTTYMLAAIVEK